LELKRTGCEFVAFEFLEVLLLASSAKLCRPRQFDSSDWFVCVRGQKIFLRSMRVEGNIREGGRTNEEDKPVEVNSILYDEKKNVEELFNRKSGDVE
jgi:hypothetical protein